MQIRFCILPPQKISDFADKLAQKFSREYPHWFVVDNKNLFPHITLFSLNVSKADRRKLENALEKLAKNFKKFNLAINGLIAYSDNDGGWLAIKIQPKKDLTKLRKKFYTKLKVYARGSTPLRRYFSPHITLIKYKKHGWAVTMRQKEKNIKKLFKAGTIAICLNDEFWQVTKILKRFKLK